MIPSRTVVSRPRRTGTVLAVTAAAAALAVAGCGSSSSGGSSNSSGHPIVVGLVFTSDPTVEQNGLTVLTDDKNLQASDNIVPLVQSSLASGAAASALNAIDAKLDQSTLVALNGGVVIQHGTATQVATQFLSQSGLNSASALCGGKRGSGKVLVGSASFAENEILAALYADALHTCGYSTSTKSFSSREVYYPEVVKGKIQVVPEYAATLTDFINGKKNGPNAPSQASGDINMTMAHLKAELPSSLAVLTPATATDKNAFAVKKSVATANNLSTLSQLGTYSKSHPVELAGPPECPTRPFCEPGLKSTYGMVIKSFKQTDEGGPLTIKAITSS